MLTKNFAIPTLQRTVVGGLDLFVLNERIMGTATKHFEKLNSSDNLILV